MTKWEYVTVPLLVHATKQILDNWGQDGWELVQVVPGLNPENLVAYLKRPIACVTLSASERLAELGLTLPPVPAPVAAYVPAVRVGDLVFTSGQLPIGGRAAAGDRPGRRRGDPEEAYALCPGRRAQRAGRGRPRWPAASTRSPGSSRSWSSWPARRASPASRRSANGASDVLGEIFGGAGEHARSAVGVASLPLDAPVEVELVVAVGASPTIQPL